MDTLRSPLCRMFGDSKLRLEVATGDPHPLHKGGLGSAECGMGNLRFFADAQNDIVGVGGDYCLPSAICHLLSGLSP